MRSYETRRSIAAEPDSVWSILTDGDRLVAADTGIRRITGQITSGGTFTLWSDAAPDRGFTTRVVEMEAPRRMVWEGGLPAGLFRGVRTFSLTATDAGTEFVMREEFTGLLLPLIWRSMPDLQPSFEAFADGLAAATESAR